MKRAKSKLVGRERRIERALEQRIAEMLGRQPCVLLTGPYEIGKSELASRVAERFGEDTLILNAAQKGDRERMAGADGLVLARRDGLLVIDEVQSFADGLLLIREALEARRACGGPTNKFLLLGSNSIEAEQLVYALLGTNAEIQTLGAITIDELPEALQPPKIESVDLALDEPGAISPILQANSQISMETLWLRGGFPKSLLADNDEASFGWRRRYIDALCGRNYRYVSSLLSASSIREVFGRLAACQGEPLDRSKREQKAIVDLFEDLGILRTLRPWFPNRLKRFEKRPKLYICDSGLLHALLGIRNLEELRNEPVTLGHSWEGFCIENLIAASPAADPFFFREDEDCEIDLVLDCAGGRRIGIEIKSPSAKVGEGLVRASEIIGVTDAFVVRPRPEPRNWGPYRELPLRNMVDILRGA